MFSVWYSREVSTTAYMFVVIISYISTKISIVMKSLFHEFSGETFGNNACGICKNSIVDNIFGDDLPLRIIHSPT